MVDPDPRQLLDSDPHQAGSRSTPSAGSVSAPSLDPDPRQVIDFESFLCLPVSGLLPVQYCIVEISSKVILLFYMPPKAPAYCTFTVHRTGFHTIHKFSTSVDTV